MKAELLILNTVFLDLRLRLCLCFNKQLLQLVQKQSGDHNAYAVFLSEYPEEPTCLIWWPFNHPLTCRWPDIKHISFVVRCLLFTENEIWISFDLMYRPSYLQTIYELLDHIFVTSYIHWLNPKCGVPCKCSF